MNMYIVVYDVHTYSTYSMKQSYENWNPDLNDPTKAQILDIFQINNSNNNVKYSC